MLDERNRKFKTDSYTIAVFRQIFIWWLKQENYYKEYFNNTTKNKRAYKGAWIAPNDPEDFLGRCSFMWEAFNKWFEFLKENYYTYTKYINNFENEYNRNF